MPVQITIIGLGQVGASMGLALAAHKDSVLSVGHDKDFSVERAALQKGAVEKTEHNLPKAVKDARLVVLAVPASQVRETLEFIAPDLLPGTVVVDTIPVKAQIVKWAKEILPQHVYHVGIVPTIAAEYLHEIDRGLDAARADLFKNSTFLVDAAYGVPGEAAQLVTNFISLLGANSMITETLEADGLMASAYLLPQLTSAAMVNATVSQPGWLEARKVAERAYHASTNMMDDAETLSLLAMHDRQNVTRVLNAVIQSLAELRDAIEDGDEQDVKQRIQSAKQSRDEWVNDRFSATWLDKKTPPIEKMPLKERWFGSILGRSVKPRDEKK